MFQDVFYILFLSFIKFHDDLVRTTDSYLSFPETDGRITDTARRKYRVQYIGPPYRRQIRYIEFYNPKMAYKCLRYMDGRVNLLKFFCKLFEFVQKNSALYK